MPIFKVACTWQMCGELLVEADTLDEAVAEAIEKEDKYGATPLPDGADYIDSSFFIDPDMSKHLNEK